MKEIFTAKSIEEAKHLAAEKFGVSEYQIVYRILEEPKNTCEHIINQTMIRLFGCGRSVSAHIERKKSKLDYRLTACPTEEQIKNLENTVNQIIMQHLPVTTEFITQEEAKGRFDLKRLPEDASETVRVVKVGDYDECLCIGTHVANTSEIGTFKIISHDWDGENKRWRIRFKLV